MRRLLLVLTFLSLVGWSQPAQPQAQPPIVVRVETPPAPPRDAIGLLQALGPAYCCIGGGWGRYHAVAHPETKPKTAKVRRTLRGI